MKREQKFNMFKIQTIYLDEKKYVGSLKYVAGRLEIYRIMAKIGTRDYVLDRSCIMLQTSFHILKYILLYIPNISIRLMIRKQC